MQLIGLCIYAICLCIYNVLQWQEIEEALDFFLQYGLILPDGPTWSDMKPLVVANASITAIYVLFVSFVTWKLYDEFQWKIFKQLNADLIVRRRYFTFKVRDRAIITYPFPDRGMIVHAVPRSLPPFSSLMCSSSSDIWCNLSL